jgi:transitional endoplasmic reticulum ATPase
MESLPGGVYEDFKTHCDGHRTETGLILSDFMRKHHPDYTVTQTVLSNCDLSGFAAAGHAKIELDTEGQSFEFTRSYHPPAHRMGNHGSPERLVDVVSFGKFKYTWNNLEYLHYRVTCSNSRSAREPYSFVLAPTSSGTSTDGHHSAIDDLLIAVGRWSSALHKEIFVFDNGSWTKNKTLWKAVQKSTWDEVILDPTMKQNLIEDVLGFFDSHDLYREFQVPWKRGIIFHGLPGNGKTISIKALMAALNQRSEPIPSLYVKSLDSCHGTKYSIRAIFNQARSMTPCLLVFEDLDSLITDKTRSYFLNEVDGLESNDGILMVGSTNHLDKLDPAICDRPSRFDRKYHFKLPGEAERIAYARFWQKKLVKNNSIEFPDALCSFTAKLTEGFSFAYLKELFVATLLAAARGSIGEEKYSSTIASSQDSPENIKDDKSNKVKLRLDALGAIQIPEELSGNRLTKVMKNQAYILQEEMDSNIHPGQKDF